MNVIVTNKGGSISYLPRMHGKSVAFHPGINEIDENALDEVMQVQGKKWTEHYSGYLIVKEPDEDPTPEDKRSAREIKATIESMDDNELLVLKEAEENRVGGARKTVMTAIEKELESRTGGDSTEE